LKAKNNLAGKHPRTFYSVSPPVSLPACLRLCSHPLPAHQPVGYSSSRGRGLAQKPTTGQLNWHQFCSTGLLGLRFVLKENLRTTSHFFPHCCLPRFRLV